MSRTARLIWILSISGRLIGVFTVCSGLYLLMGAMDGTLNSRWYPWKVHESKQTGNQIIEGLEHYRAREGHYSAELTDLVPRDIASIKNPPAGSQQWSYEPEQNNSEFELAFMDTRASVPRWYYKSSDGRWYFKSF